MWSKAFWKDALERVLGTVLAALAVAIPVDLAGVKELQVTEVAAGIGLLALATLVKCLLAVLKNPNTGGSFGTAVPGDLVAAQTDTSGSHPGDTIAGPATDIPTGTPVELSPDTGPSPYPGV